MHCSASSSTTDFNSRPSARGDRKAPPACATPKISIHAPPRGATAKNFAEIAMDLFQFTPLREGRQQHREETAELKISIHAPPRGATATSWKSRSAGKISIHAPPRGATAYEKGFDEFNKFQFTPLREGRQRGATTMVCTAIFQFTPLREGRPASP